MVKRHADGAFAACASSCLDVLPCKLQQQAVLGSIENLPTTIHPEASRITSNKKQCRLGLDQGPKPVDASWLFAQARAVLRQPSYAVNEAPVGREQEFEKLTEAFEEFRSSGCGSSIYVSGLPGTGKSHTVRKSLCHLLHNSSKQEQRDHPNSSVLVTWVNCMSVSSAEEVYAQIAATTQTGLSSEWQQHQQHDQESDELSASDEQQQQQRQSMSLSFEALLGCLQQQQQHTVPSHSSKAPSSCSSKVLPSSRKRHRAARSSSSSGDNSSQQTPSSKHTASGSSSSSSVPQYHIVVLDEVDNLAKRSLSALVQAFKLPHEPGVHLLLVGIANSIDLTERTLPELRLQLVPPRLITFNAYTSRHVATILDSVVQQLPCKLFEPSALQLCSRSVGASSGDVRHALKACRAAIDELEQQQQQQPGPDNTSQGAAAAIGADLAPPPAAPVATVGPRQMSAALSRLAGVRSSQFGAQAASIIRSLPNQQQLLLYALAVICQQPATEDTSASSPVTPQKGSKAATSSLWKGAGTAAVLNGSRTGGSPSSASNSWAQGLKKKKAAGASSSLGQADTQGSVFVLAVSADAAYLQYLQVCKLLKLPSCTKCELLHMADLMSQMALLDVLRAPGAAAGTGSTAGGLKGGGVKGSSSGGGLKGLRGSSKLGGLGGLGGAAGAGRGGGSKLGCSPLGAAAAASGAKAGEVKLSLRASSAEVFAALKHNHALRCLVDG